MPYHIDEENSELAFEVREGNKLVIKIKSNIFSDSLELYLIKVGDNTEPTDKNVFSSLRVLKEIENLHDTILKEINSVTSGFWELKQDSQGNEYIATKYNVLTEGGLTTYGLGEQKLGTIYDGLPIDNDTIYWEEVEGSRVLKAKGSGGGSTGLDETKLWNVLGTPGDQQIDYSHLRSAFSQFSNEFVTINTEQEVTALKHFTAGLSIGSAKKKIYEKDGVLYIDSNVAITGALTMYATDGQSVSSIYDGLPIDNDTIYWETVEGSRILKAKGGSSFDENAMWVALSGSSDNQINKSHLTTALDGYATRNWVIENYATKSELSAVSNKLNDFLEGSDTDNIINKWKELEAFLSGMAETDNLAEILKTKADRSYVDSTFVTLATKQTITGEKTFSSVLNTAAIKASGAITAPSLAASDYVTIAGIKLRKLEDGALMLEGNLALTGALTMYASNGQSFDTIYDGLPIDNDTIYWQEVDGSRVLKAREGSGSSFDKSAMWTALAGSTTEQINKSHLTTALTGYATESWVSGKNYAVKATTLAGYGITDGVNAVSVTGTGNAVTAASISGHTLTLTKGSTFSLSGHKHAWADITSGKPSTLSGYGITDAYTKTESDNKYPTKTGSGASGTWGINVTGNAGTATKLQTARTLWGRSFDGTGNVSGNLDSVGNITGSGTIDVITKNNQNIRFKINNDDTLSVLLELKSFRPFGAASNSINLGLSDAKWKDLYLGGNANIDGVTKTEDFYIGGIRLHKTADGVITLEGNLAVTGGVTMYAIDPVSASTIMDGVVVDGTTIKKENGKLVAVGGGEAGSVVWGNISGKPSVFATNIANITDLHSSWDAVLAAQKPAWLTAVSIATISDLHANWDALLKATPSAYVTRWPSFAEVTSKPTTLSGYGITDAPTKTGSGASGTWGIGITGNAATASKWATARTITLGSYLSGSVSLDGSANVTLNADVIGLTSQGNKTAVSGNTAPASGVRLYQVYNNGYPTPYGNLLSVKGGGAGELLLSWHNSNRIYYRSLRDNGDNWLGWNQLAFTTDNVASATKLQTARTLWGRSFDGTNNVTGNIDIGNNDIIGYAGARIIQNLGSNLGINPSGYVGIGTTSPSYKLHVNGGIYGSSDIRGARYILEDNTFTGLGSSEMFTSNLSSIRYSSDGIYVNGGTFRPIIRWGDIVNGRGYQTRYVFGSVRDDANDWGRIFMAVSNNDAGTSTGCSFSIYGGGYVEIVGNLLVSGGATFYSSDIRYKSIMQQVELSLLSIANAPSFVYRWNRPNMNQNRLNLGGSAQYTQSVLPWAVENSNNFLSMDYATVAYTFAVHTARHLLTYETRTDKKIKKLENRVKYLEKQLKKLNYEEAGIVDDQSV